MRRGKALAQNEIELNAPDYNDNEFTKPSIPTTEHHYVPTTSGEFKMKKTLGLLEGIALIVGVMIGSGIFSSPRSVAKNTGSVGMSLVVWVGSGVIAILGALCFVELGTMIRESGGERQYLSKAFGEWAGFMFAWSTIIVLKPSSLSAICMACGEYIVEAIQPGCGKLAESAIKVKLIASFLLGKFLYFLFIDCNKYL
eukprot:gene18964-20870_t